MADHQHTTRIFIEATADGRYRITSDPPPSPFPLSVVSAGPVEPPAVAPSPVVCLAVTSADPVELPAGPLTADQLNCFWGELLPRTARIQWGEPLPAAPRP